MQHFVSAFSDNTLTIDVTGLADAEESGSGEPRPPSFPSNRAGLQSFEPKVSMAR